MSTQAKKQPVRRYYMLAVILMFSGLVKFPWGQGASLDPSALAMALVVSFSLIALSVACVIRGRRNRIEG